MVWRRSSAMDAFLQQLAQSFKHLPRELLQSAPGRGAPATPARAQAARGR
jgi:hypothetical protein